MAILLLIDSDDGRLEVASLSVKFLVVGNGRMNSRDILDILQFLDFLLFLVNFLDNLGSKSLLVILFELSSLLVLGILLLVVVFPAWHWSAHCVDNCETRLLT